MRRFIGSPLPSSSRRPTSRRPSACACNWSLSTRSEQQHLALGGSLRVAAEIGQGAMHAHRLRRSAHSGRQLYQAKVSVPRIASFADHAGDAQAAVGEPGYAGRPARR